jgi:hypothetical protein
MQCLKYGGLVMSTTPGIWKSDFCAYNDKHGPVLAAYANGNDAASKGYLNYLSFSGDGVKFQNGPIMDGHEKVTIHDVPSEIADAAIKAAMGVVIGHLVSKGAKL